MHHPADLRSKGSAPTHFMNVDLDVASVVPLDGLVRAFGDDVCILYVGGRRRKYEAHVELAASHKISADETILELARLVVGLPPAHRKIWNSAKSRKFNVGIDAGLEPRMFELRLGQRSLEAIPKVNETLVVTVYASEMPVIRATGDPEKRSVSKRRSGGGG